MEKHGLDGKVSRRQLLKWAGIGTAGALLAACQPQIVEVEKEVTKVVEVTKIVKEVVKETVMVAGTPKVVEREITKIVKEEVEKVVTATPAPPKEIEMLFTCGWGAGMHGDSNVTLGDMYMERNPHAKLEVLPGTNMNKVLTMIAGGTPPDVFHNYYCNMAQLGYQGTVIPIVPYIDASVPAAYDNFGEWEWYLAYRAGQLYAVPYKAWNSRGALAWNGRLLERAGLDPDTSPKTVEEFLDMAVKATVFDDAGNIDVLGWSPETVLEIWSHPMDVSWYDPVRRKFHIYQEAFVKLWKQFKAYSDELGGFEKIGGWGAANVGQTGMFTEKLVFYQGQTWVPGNILQNAPEVWPHWRHDFLPSAKGLKTIQTAGHMLAIPREAPDPDASWPLIEFFCASMEAGNLFWDLLGGCYPWKPWQEKTDFSARPQFQWYMNAPSLADIVSPRWPREVCAYVGNPLGLENSAFEAVLTGQLEVEEALERLEKETQALLDQAVAEYG